VVFYGNGIQTLIITGDAENMAIPLKGRKGKHF